MFFYVVTFCHETDAEGKQLIRNAMKVWEKHVCVHFKEREQESNYIEFVYKKG